MKQEHLDLLKKVLGDEVVVESELVGGMMNEAYIVKNKEGRFVYYISTAQANEMVDRNLEKETQNIAFNLGLTSENVYFDLEKGIKINRFLEGSSLNKIEEFDYKEVAKLLFKFHSSNKKASVYYDPLTRLENYKKEALTHTEKFEPEFDELYQIVQQNKGFLLSQPLTLAHNDAQRSNIIKCDDGKYYLIDFEFAANNDPIYDIATFGNGSALEGKKLLEEYIKLSPTKDALKRYVLWRIDISLQWYLVATIKHYRGEGKIHGFDFLAVGKFFLGVAQEALRLLK
jgi:thiamine kinase-like enzyme